MIEYGKAYLEYEKIYNTKYGKYYQQYPYAMLLFNAILRNNERRDKSLAIATLNRLKSNAKKDLKTLIRRLLYFTSSIINAKPSDKISILDNMSSRFNYLASVLEDVCIEHNIRIVKYHQIRNFKCDHFNASNKLLVDPLIFGPITRKVINRLTLENIHEMLNDTDVMDQLNSELERNVKKLSIIMHQNNIKLVLATGDLGYIKQFISSAAKTAGIPYYVMLHGYPHDGKYIGVLPISCDKLLVWNNEIKDRLTQILQLSMKPEDAEKIEVFGYPVYDYMYINKLQSCYHENPNKVTFISQPFEELGQKINRDLLYGKLKELQKKGLTVQVRLHPKERDKAEKYYLIKQYNLDISNSSLIKDLMESRIILGFNSSVMYEAALLNKSVYQIKGLKQNNPYANMKEIDIDDIPEISRICNDVPNGAGGFLIDDFKQKLKALLAEVQIID